MKKTIRKDLIFISRFKHHDYAKKRLLQGEKGNITMIERIWLCLQDRIQPNIICLGQTIFEQSLM